MPATDTSQPQTSSSPWRRVVWILIIGVVLVVVINSLVPELTGLEEEGVALVRVEGVILDARQTVDDLIRFGENPNVKAIVLRIDSPGGGVVPSQEIHDAVQRIREEYGKTIVASMGSIAASGGYYIAVATDHIMANPGTLTGSIGVIMQLANVRELLEKIGVKSRVIKSGEHKDLASPFREMSQEERRILQSVMDDVHHQFIQAVAKGRSMGMANVKLLADGRIFSGRQAMDNQLVDGLGNLHEAIQLAAKMGGIKGEPRVVEPPKRFSFFEMLENRLAGWLPSLDVRPSVNLMYLMAV